MGYQQALEAAGAKIRAFKEFGSYQGDWFAITEDDYVIQGSYGSCSGCDAFEAEFGYDSHNLTDKQYQSKLASFGQEYLMNPEHLNITITRYTVKSEDEYWGAEDREIRDWLLSELRVNN
jgi:hypothetical protein